VLEQKRIITQVNKPVSERETIMADKSPKSVRKQATQKRVKTDSASQKKQEDTAAKQAAHTKS
jgi:hypothetical protein